MELFVPTLNQMIYLFALIAIGFVLVKCKVMPDNSATVLSKLANTVLTPALVMSTFIKECTVEKISLLWPYLVVSILLAVILIPLSLFTAKLCFKGDFERKIAAYGLGFSNFGFMGYTIVRAIFPEIELEYTVFTLPFWCTIYAWAVPTLLIPREHSEGKPTFAARIKPFINPMMIGLLIGLALGLLGGNTWLPVPIKNVVFVAGDCMSPIAMLLTGMTIGKINVWHLLKKWRLYVVTAVRLLVYPMLFLGVLWLLSLLPQNEILSMFINPTFFKCAMCMVAMPMGLTSIVVPAAYGKDTSDAAGLALFTHLFSVGTIPLMFTLLQLLVL